MVANLFSLRQDIVLAVRKLKKKPLFAAIAILSLALGIGANTAIFSVVNSVLLERLPYRAPERLVRIWESFPLTDGHGRGSVSVPNLRDWQAQSTSFEAIGGYRVRSYNLAGASAPIRVLGTAVMPETFPILDAPAQIGRALGDGDRMRDRVAVIGHDLWQRTFGGDSGIVGRTIRLDGESHDVVGVMPPDFEFPAQSAAQIWTPLVIADDLAANRGSHWMGTIGRLRDGVALATARAELETVAARIAERHPAQQEDRSVVLEPLSEAVVAHRRPALLALWGASALILLIACANVANLMLARAATQHREMSVRAALGAGRRRLAQQVLLESALLATIGGAVGLAIGWVAVRFLAAMPGNSLPSNHAVVFDARIFLACALASILAATLAGLVPALRASRIDLQSAMKDRAATASGGHRDPIRSGLVVAEIALAIVVLIGAGLLVRSLLALEAVDSGIRAERVLTMRVPLSDQYDTAEKINAFYGRLIEETGRLPGVVSAGTISLLPIQSWGYNGNFTIEGRPPLPPGQQPFAEYRTVGGDYFGSLGIALVGGRGFTPRDTAEAPAVALINQAAVARYWGEEDPIGQRVGGGDDWATIVGVVGDVRNTGLRRTVSPELYFPLAQSPRQQMSLVVRTEMDPREAAAPIREAVRGLDPELPLHRVETMGQVIDNALSGARFNSLLFSLFGVLALVLATLGVYGVVSYNVTQRTGEIGVRMALGANRGHISRLVVRQGLLLGVLGSLGGLAAALGMTRFLSSQVYGVGVIDPMIFGATAAFLVGIAVLACLLPAHRAATVPPTIALRAE